ncbi:FAD/NAD(P)-binding protein [Allorhodopirellula solitaria]|uniref:FAD-dependent urate hydroxylase HpyO/Asp monooxygenase CreE-like FAD/NAD(P)-binding domain-containing protein n=1 Tax=Allorhodopirellula solitaria TaxID=2527987 RepID=A0A5C5XXH1_9BACT|nr:FAD/NAD(P)-binding domain-containing protein [Allorhodopirellula solitaria]TWT67398.1 hypothetical protein CA85_22480 [Allorhodopirellula solitaria]
MKVVDRARSDHDDALTAGRSGRLRLAVVGCGPRGMQCLEALSRRLDDDQLSRLQVTVYEPAETLGAGSVYDPCQSQCLRMNFATQHIDFWKSTRDQQTSRATSLLGWLATRYPDLAQTNQYIPRAVLGEYLRDCFAEVRERFIGSSEWAVQPEHVFSIVREQTEFRVNTRSSCLAFDRVVVTTGHEGLRSSATVPANDTIIPALPSNANLSVAAVPAKSRVLVHGFGLTAIDTVLSLTESRGGRFVSDRFLPCYIHSLEEPRRIEIQSRSGRPMLAKPTSAMEPICNSFWDAFRERMLEKLKRHGDLHFREDIWPFITGAAAERLIQSGCPSSQREVQAFFRSWSRGKMDSQSAVQAMLRSYAVAVGERPIDIAFALGDAWRSLYPELVRLISHGGLAAASWNSFATTAREMERIAFGPPAESVGRMLTLMRDGVLTIGTQHEDQSQFDAVINAVIAGPHEHFEHGPLRSLIQSGDVQIDPDSGGVKVDENGTAIGAARGLAVFGRATEGWIVGNDTLTRTLHNHIENWAETVRIAIADLEPIRSTQE